MSERPELIRHDSWSSTEWTRRRVLGLGGALGLATAGGLTLSGAMAHRPASTGNQLRSAVPLPKPYTVPLQIPPVLKPLGTSGAADRYEITQRHVSA